MASTQTLAQLWAELAKQQRTCQSLSKKIDSKSKEYEAEVWGVVLTAEQVSSRGEVVNQLLEELYRELRCFRETLKKTDEEVNRLECAIILLTLKEAV
ncbi:hypothetical protein L873DRAFT_1808040 [Choiromyces venosus 120613-1]|uniref:Uncharacterized protein n=1 Tax=Choiromyces venosus 120613-1 TaxID=1336337 RepID=A0A3N4JXL6_9PEZI|nr:hypothetical protein L873DRAFT_1808040 [Choiromyces venosus 120613-1]